MENEVWKSVVGHEGFYEVSSIGNVRSVERVITYVTGVKTPSKGVLMKLQIDHGGYHRIKLSRNKKIKFAPVHRLVAIAFIPNPNNYPQVNHLNGIKTDNRIENLEWCTTQQNVFHAFRTGLKHSKIGAESHFYGKKGLDCANSKLVKSTITGEILNQGMAAKKLGMREARFGQMILGRIRNKTEYIRI